MGVTADGPLLRIGTWNLAGRGGPRRHDFLDALACDVLLLTEVPEGLDLPGWQVHVSEAQIRAGVWFAAVAARSLEPRPSPHPASALADALGWRCCSSVLPWRSSGGAAPWAGEDQGARTAAACRDLGTARLDVWGGDWNHALDGRDWAGSRAGRAAIEETLGRLGLRAATAALPAASDSQRSIDHIAVQGSSAVESAVRVVAADARGRLSDHDAYVVTARLGQTAGAEDLESGTSGEHRWLPLAYGFPTRATFDAMERGELLLGGCVDVGSPPVERCVACGAER